MVLSQRQSFVLGSVIPCYCPSPMPRTPTLCDLLSYVVGKQRIYWRMGRGLPKSVLEYPKDGDWMLCGFGKKANVLEVSDRFSRTLLRLAAQRLHYIVGRTPFGRTTYFRSINQRS